MSNFRVPGLRQTPWACGHRGQIWYACVHPDISDEAVIDMAKRIVDKALPQKLSTFFGGHYYSFTTREYLLNLILFYYQDHGHFPTGAVCIVERWVWDGLIFRHRGRWLKSWIWRFSVRRADLKPLGYWVQIPAMQSILCGE